MTGPIAYIGYDDGREFLADRVARLSLSGAKLTITFADVPAPHRGTIDRARLVFTPRYSEDMFVNPERVGKGWHYTLIANIDFENRTLRPMPIRKRGLLRRLLP